MKKRHYLVVLAIFLAVGWGGIIQVFDIPKQAEIVTLEQDEQGRILQCYQRPLAADGVPDQLDQDGKLRLLVWNIYKQNRPQWHYALSQWGEKSDLLLLQEVNMNADFKDWLSEQGWAGMQANAFRVLGESTGVMNLAKIMPLMACAYLETEPWLRLPKSGIYATYPLSNGQQLAVINLHAVNFSYGTQEYQTQLARLFETFMLHQGPIIVAGDFNSWSKKRMALLTQALADLEFKEVAFMPDHRRRFLNGLALDHIFYKNLVLTQAQTPETRASDHNPLLAEFKLMTE